MSDTRAESMLSCKNDRPPPIDFIGEWDAVVVPHNQVTYGNTGFRVYLTEDQIDKLLESRMTARRAGRSHRAGTPLFYMQRDEDGEMVLVRDVDGVITKGSFLNGQFEAH